MTTTTSRVRAKHAAPRSIPTGDSPIIFADKAEKRFGDIYAVRDLTIAVPRGVICAMVGPSGSGKTTGIRMMNGFYRPTGGEIQVMGVNPSRFRVRHRANIGYVPQSFALYPNLTVIENMNFASSLYGIGWFGRGKRHRQLLELVDLWEHRNKKAADISGGMKRRLALAAGLVHNPQLVFLDEPTAGIDPMLRTKFWEEFRRLADTECTIFVTTQYVTEAEYCDLVAVMDNGAVIAFGTPEELRKSASGTEELELEAPGMSRDDLQKLWNVQGVESIERVGPESFRIQVDDAATALPAAMEALREADGSVTSLREHRPNFDEVFVRLVENVRHEEQPPDSGTAGWA